MDRKRAGCVRMKCECAPKYVFLDIFLLISALKCITLDDHRWHAEWKTSDTRAGAKLALVSLEQLTVREILGCRHTGRVCERLGWMRGARRSGKAWMRVFQCVFKSGHEAGARAASSTWWSDAADGRVVLDRRLASALAGVID